MVASEYVAAMIAEPVLGEGGFVVPPPEFFPQLLAICHQHGIVFIADEVQTGFARTGAMFACERYGIVPDVSDHCQSRWAADFRWRPSRAAPKSWMPPAPEDLAAHSPEIHWRARPRLRSSTFWRNDDLLSRANEIGELSAVARKDWQ